MSKEIHRVILSKLGQTMDVTRHAELDSFSKFFDFMIQLEQAHLIMKKEIVHAFTELFECA